jgi:hypothetical protein
MGVVLSSRTTLTTNLVSSLSVFAPLLFIFLFFLIHTTPFMPHTSNQNCIIFFHIYIYIYKKKKLKENFRFYNYYWLWDWRVFKLWIMGLWDWRICSYYYYYYYYCYFLIFFLYCKIIYQNKFYNWLYRTMKEKKTWGSVLT